jgi:predicted ATPase/class 3 adenylate cyclase
MSYLLHTLAAYVPPAIVRATLSETSPEPPTAARSEFFPAAVLFADISGFTPLTEALAQKGSEGPEELTRLLNAYFSRMIAVVEAQGGEVVKFSGDALTVLFPAAGEDLAHATRRAWQAAQAMQAAMDEFATLETSVGPVALGMKIGVGAGKVLAAHVGGLSKRWEYIIAGDPLRQVAQAEHQAERGEIILSPEAQATLFPHALPPRPLSQPDWTAVQDPQAVETVLQCYVPGIVSAWLGQELHDWLAVLRPMTVLFGGLSGLDYTHPDAVTRLHTFLHAAQELIQHYDGSINKLAVDDKGTILLALFGAPPRAHENDPERALRCAMDLQAMAERQGLQLALGVTTGRVFAGPVGSPTRREYTVMGDTVNLAARLMGLPTGGPVGLAGPGQIHCDYETYHSARNRLAFDLLLPVRVKGKAGLIRIYRPLGEAGKTVAEPVGGALVGRRAEMTRITACLDDVHSGRSRILLIEGEAGIGKSRLAEEMVQLMRERGLAGLLGTGRSIEQQTPYRAWRDIFISYFLLEDVTDPVERQTRVEAHVTDVDPDLIERLPLLNDVLNLAFPENALTASLDTQLRHDSLISLLLALLRAWAAERPLVLVFEDAQWLDSLSWDLILQAARALTVARAPLLLTVVMRPLEEETVRLEPQALADMAETERLLLTTLTPDETVALAAARLGIAAADLPQPVAELVRTRSGGNPFFAEELIYALRDNDLIRVLPAEEPEIGNRCVVEGDLERAVQTLPDTIQGLVLSRIDRLPPEEQLTLKVAAVIGRTFAFAPLRDTLGEYVGLSQRLLRSYLDDLAQLALTALEAPEPELTYIFKHIITQEVAYQTLLFAQRRQLHRAVAEWYERTFSESLLAPYYPLLAYHWQQAEERERERRYAALAGHWAAAQFANAEAAGYFSRALELTPQSDLLARYDLLLAREAVNDLRGERQAQEQDLVALAGLVDALRDSRRSAQVALRLTNYTEVTSDYSGALLAVQQAIEQAAQAQDQTMEAEGYIAWGKVLWRQGQYEAARAPLDRALTLARAANNRYVEAQSMQALGHLYLYQGHYPHAQTHYRHALEIYRAEGHPQGEADNLINLGSTYYELGDYPAARDTYAQALNIFQNTGDRRGATFTLNNLGTVYCDLGDYAVARDFHQQALDIRLAIGDAYGEAASLVNLGLVYHSLGDHETARRHCERALAIQQEIGDPRGQGYSLTYLGHALTSLGELKAAAAAYDQAIRLRREMGQYSLLLDDFAGLARIAVAQGQTAQALEIVEDILTWIEFYGLAGIEYPLQVYLTCYHILQSTPDRAQEVLSAAHGVLMERAASIRDEALRLKFLQDVEVNREIMAASRGRRDAKKTPGNH